MFPFVLLKFYLPDIAFSTISSLKKITGPQDCFEILPIRKLKKVKKHCLRGSFNNSAFYLFHQDEFLSASNKRSSEEEASDNEDTTSPEKINALATLQDTSV